MLLSIQNLKYIVKILITSVFLCEFFFVNLCYISCSITCVSLIEILATINLFKYEYQTFNGFNG